MVRDPTSVISNLSKGIHHTSNRGRCTFIKKCNISCLNAALLPKQGILGSQETRQFSSSHRPLPPKSVHREFKIQDDKSNCRSRSNSTRGMGNNLGHTGRLPAYSNTTTPSQVPGLYDKRSALFFPSLTLRTSNSPKGLHNDNEMAPTGTASAKHTVTSISGRPINLGSIGNSNPLCDKYCNEDITRSRIPVKLNKIDNNTLSTLHVVGNIILHTNYDLVHPKGKTTSHAEKCQRTHNHCVRQQENMGKSDRSSSLLLSGSETSQTNFLPLGKATGLRSHIIQRHNTRDSFAPIASACSLDKFGSSISISSMEDTGTNAHSMDRCVHGGMGLLNFKQSCGTRPLVNGRKNVEHQSPRIISNPKGNDSTGIEQRECTRIHGQRNCAVFHKQDGKSQQSNPPPYQSDNEVGTKSQTDLNSSQDYIQSKHSSGSPQSIHCTTDGMGIIHEHFQRDSEMAREAHDRLDGNPTKHQTSKLHLSLRAPDSIRNGCSIDRLEPVSGNLRIPSNQPNPKTNTISKEIQREGRDHSTVAPHGTMVPYNMVKIKGPLTPIQKRLANGIRGRKVRRLQILRKVDRLQFLKQIWLEKYGKVTSEQLSLSFRKSSSNQYQSVWRCFQSWLPPSVNILKKAHVLRFLIWLHKKKKLSSKTVLSYRGALSLPLKMGFGIETKDKDFNLLARAQFLDRPAPKKKVPNWSVNHALEFFKQPRFNNRRASAKDLFLKCIFLTAIASGNRASELSACVRGGIVQSGNTISIPVKDKFLYKNQRANSSPNIISFPSLPRQELCPVACLLKYIKMTENLSHNNYLFVHPSSNKPLKSGRLSYWLVQALKLATPNFKGTAHEVRGQAYSAAWARGVPMERILKEGFWLTPNVFIDNYLNSVDSLITPFIGGRHLIKP